MVREMEVNLYQEKAIQTGIDAAVDTLDQSLDQEEVFNRLTNNQLNQGIYIENGQVYINASMIHAGTMSANRIQGGVLDLGGNSNVGGKLRIKDASGNVIGSWDNSGLNVDGGTISGGSLETDTYTDLLDNGYKYAVNENGFLCYLNGSVVSKIFRDATDLTLQSNSITLDGAVAVEGTFSANRGISIPMAYGLVTDEISSYSGILNIDSQQILINGNASATTSDAGLMSAADKTKLDNVCHMLQYDLAVTSVSCAANASTVVLNWEDLSQVIGAGNTLKGAVFLWANGGKLYAPNCTVGVGTDENKLYLALYNPTATAQAVTTVRLLLFYR